MNSEEEEEEEDDETVSAGAVSSVAGKRGGRKRGEDYEGVSRSGGEWSEGSSGTVDLSLPDSFDDTLDFVAIAAGGGRGRVGGGGSGSGSVATGVAAGITAGITTGTVGVVTSLSTKTELVSHVHHLESLLKKNEMLHREELGECKERARREREERAREAREHEKEIRLMEQSEGHGEEVRQSTRQRKAPQRWGFLIDLPTTPTRTHLRGKTSVQRTISPSNAKKGNKTKKKVRKTESKNKKVPISRPRGHAVDFLRDLCRSISVSFCRQAMRLIVFCLWMRFLFFCLDELIRHNK